MKKNRHFSKRSIVTANATKMFSIAAGLASTVALSPVVNAQQTLLSDHIQKIWKQPEFSNFSIDTSSTGYTGLIDGSTNSGTNKRDTTKWNVLSIYNLVDNDTTNFASVRLVTDGSALSNNRTSASATLKINNNQTYNTNTFLSLELGIADQDGSLTGVENYSFVLLTSNDNVTFDTVRAFQKVSIGSDKYRIGGFSKSQFKYVKVISNLEAPTVASNRRGTVRFFNFRLSNGLFNTPCNTEFNPSYNAAVAPLVDSTLIIDESKSGLIGGVGITIGTYVSNPEYVLDANPNTAACIACGVNINLAGEYALAIKNRQEVYSAGTYLGFKVQTTSVLSVSILNGFKINTYLNGQLQESFTGDRIGLGVGVVQASTPTNMGIVTTKPADEYQIVYMPGIVDIGGVSVYNPIIKKFCEGPSLPCNEEVSMNNVQYPLHINYKKTSAVNVGIGTGIDNIDAILDTNVNNYAKIVTAVGVTVATKSELILQKVLAPYTGKNFVGFELESPSLADVGVLSSLNIKIYNNDTLVQSTSGTNLISAGVPLLTGTGARKMGVFVDATFNKVVLEFNHPVGISVAQEIKIKNYFVEKLCEGNALDCNELTMVSKPNLPLYIDYNHTGAKNGLVVIGDINNPHFAIDDDPTTAASISQPVQVSAGGVEFCVADAYNIYPANTFAGFDVEFNTLLDLAVIENIKVELLLNDSIVQTESGIKSIAGLNAGLLTGVGAGDHQLIGIVSNTPFNKIKLTIGSIVGVNLGVTNIYGVKIQQLCDEPLLCNQSYILNNQNLPIILNNAKSGTQGVAAVGSGVKNIMNVLDPDPNKYANIVTVANVLGGNAISVKNPIQEYPVGTFAGYSISNGVTGLLDLNLLQGVIIRTYLNGTMQEEKSGGNLLELNLIVPLISNYGNIKNIGFIATKPFNEIQITVGEVVGLLSNLNIYNAFVDTRTSAGGNLVCFNPVPDIAATYKDVSVSGSVKTNDLSPIDNKFALLPHNNTNATLTLDAFGNYNFQATQGGKYTYEVNSCLYDSATNTISTVCKSSVLTFIVIDSNRNDNIPVINHDAAISVGSPTAPTSININVLGNDGYGNRSSYLDPNSLVITSQPTVPGATATVITNTSSPKSKNKGLTKMNGSATGIVEYTSPAGYFGIDSFRYSVTEVPSNISSEAKVDVIIQERLYNPLICIDDYKEIGMNSTLNVDATNGLLANDQNLSDKPLTAIAETKTIQNVGTLVINSDGSYTFTPVANYSGPAQFVYSITNGEVTVQGTLHLLVSQNGAPLDIKLVSFDAKETSCNTVAINWETSKEENAAYFDIEFSANGKTFTAINRVNASNNFNGNKYAISAQQNIPAGYYRLKTVENDGTFNYSNTQRVALDCFTELVNVTPNPTSGKVQVQGLPTGATIYVSTIQGKLIQTLVNNNNTATIDLTNQPAGTYIIQVTFKDGTSSNYKVSKY